MTVLAYDFSNSTDILCFFDMKSRNADYCYSLTILAKKRVDVSPTASESASVSSDGSTDEEVAIIHSNNLVDDEGRTRQARRFVQHVSVLFMFCSSAKVYIDFRCFINTPPGGYFLTFNTGGGVRATISLSLMFWGPQILLSISGTPIMFFDCFSLSFLTFLSF